MIDIHAALRSYFGFSSFRTGQAEAIESLLSGRDTLTVMPTGAGKSLIFQLAGLMLSDGCKPAPITLVMSPLIALMKDQVDSLTRRGIPAAYINSALPLAEQNNSLERLASGEYRIVYIAPERLRNTAFLRALGQRKVCLLAVDEAHCISEWGHDFRPDYLNIARARSALGNPLTVALTATATPHIQEDILRLLGLPASSDRIITGFNRENLVLNVRYTSGLPAKFRLMKDILTPPPQGAVLVYAGTRRDTEEIATFAQEVLRVPARFYHAGLPAEERTSVQEAFSSGKLNFVAATNAFGMGIDRPDVRHVIHFAMPGSLEAYYQECGRAGRDGLPATATLLYDPQDRALHEFFAGQSALRVQDINAVYRALPSGSEVWSSLDELSLRTALHPVQIKVALSILERAGVLEHLGDEGGRMFFRRGSWKPQQVEDAAQYGREHAQNRYRELASIIRYAEANQCRRQIILNHFGDPDTSPVAGCCDNCQSALEPAETGDVAQMNPGQHAALLILDCIHRLKVKVGREKILQILTGSKSQDILKFHHDKNIYYARLSTAKKKDVEDLLMQLIDKGYIKGIGGDYPVLVLTPRGESAIQQKEFIPLRIPYSFQERPLHRPKAELVSSGAWYGASADPHISRPQPKAHFEKNAAAGSTVETTLAMFQSGLSPEQIAQERQLTVSTIYVHFAQLISNAKLRVEDVVRGDVRQQIEAAIQQVGSVQHLTPIKMLLPASIDFGTIRCVVAAMEQQTPGAVDRQDSMQGAPEEREPQVLPETEEAVDAFLARPHPRKLNGPWQTGWSLGFHSRYSGSDWSRSAVGDLAYRLKYNGDTSTLPGLVSQAVSLIQQHPELASVDCIAPVPSTTDRKVNPVMAFCEALAKELRLPLHPMVHKTRATQPQKVMKTLAQKRANVAGAFGLTGDIRGKRILLVDDLFDSGATLEEITRLLLRNGAERVNVFTLTCTIHSDQ